MLLAAESQERGGNRDSPSRSGRDTPRGSITFQPPERFPSPGTFYQTHGPMTGEFLSRASLSLSLSISRLTRYSRSESATFTCVQPHFSYRRR